MLFISYMNMHVFTTHISLLKLLPCFLSQLSPFKVEGNLFWLIFLSDGLQTEVCFGAE
jgi:hypothetical protein